MRKPTMWFSNRSDTNRTVQTIKMAKAWKFRIQKIEYFFSVYRKQIWLSPLQLMRSESETLFRIDKIRFSHGPARNVKLEPAIFVCYEVDTNQVPYKNHETF